MSAESEASTRGLDDSRGAQAYFRALQRDYEAPELTKAAITRFASVADAARRRIEADQLMRDASPAVRSSFMEMMSAISVAGFGNAKLDQSNESYWGKEAFGDALIKHVHGLMMDRIEFKRATEAEIMLMSAPDVSRLMRVNREIVNGLAMSGIEQGECMRSARLEAQELVSDVGGDKNPLGWLILGWLGLWNSSSSADTRNFFARGLSLLKDRTGFLAYLLHRYQAIGLDISGQPDQALDEAKLALAIRTSADLLFEASRYAHQSGRRIEARRYLESAVQLEPMTILVAMADSEMNGMEPVVMGCYTQAENLIRAAALKSIEEWKVVASKAQTCEKKLGVSLELPDEICSGFSEFQSLANSGGFLEILGVKSVAIQSARDVSQIAMRRVAALVNKRKVDAEEAQLIVSVAVKKRDTVTSRAEKQAEALITQMESELQRSMGSDDRAMQGCATGLGGSFAMFMVYVIAAGFLSQRGVETGWDTPFGMLGICLIAAPIAIGLGANAASGIKRSTVGSEVQRRAAHAREMAKITLIEVEKNCAKQAEELRQEATEIEREAQAAVEALRMLQETPLPSSFILPEASQQAA